MTKKEKRELIFNKYNGHCAYCGNEILYTDMQIDHIIPKCYFLSHIKNKWRVPDFLYHLTELDLEHIDNLNPACRSCNKWKSGFSLGEFRSEITEQIKRLNKCSANYKLAKRYGLITEINKPIIFYFENPENQVVKSVY